ISKLSGESLKDASGYLSGEFSVSGATDSPDYEGYLQFNDAVFNPTLLNTKFALTDDKIAINNDGIEFDDFSIADRDGNKFYIDGTISTKNITDPELDLSLDADGFQLMDSSEKDNDVFYGKANFDLHGKLTGPVSFLKADLDIDINKDTDFTYVLTDSQASMEKRDGIIEFVNKENPDDILTRADDSTNVAKITGIQLDSRIK